MVDQIEQQSPGRRAVPVFLAAAAGVLSLAWNLPPVSQRFIPLLVCGAWLAAHGGWTLVGYLREDARP